MTDEDEMANICQSESLGFGSMVTGIPDPLNMVGSYDEVFKESKNFSQVDQFRKSSM